MQEKAEEAEKVERWRRRRGRRWTAKDGLTFLRHLRGPLSHHVLGKRNRPKTRGLFGISSSVIISFDEGERGLRAGALDPRPWILDVMGCRMHPRVSSFFFLQRARWRIIHHPGSRAQPEGGD